MELEGLDTNAEVFSMNTKNKLVRILSTLTLRYQRKANEKSVRTWTVIEMAALWAVAMCHLWK